MSNVEKEKTVSPIVTEENHPTVTPKVKKERKAKKTTEPKVEETVEPKTVFPANGFVNPWGFIHLSQKIVEAFGATKGTKTPITIDLQDGALIVKKA